MSLTPDDQRRMGYGMLKLCLELGEGDLEKGIERWADQMGALGSRPPESILQNVRDAARAKRVAGCTCGGTPCSCPF